MQCGHFAFFAAVAGAAVLASAMVAPATIAAERTVQKKPRVKAAPAKTTPRAVRIPAATPRTRAVVPATLPSGAPKLTSPPAPIQLPTASATTARVSVRFTNAKGQGQEGYTVELVRANGTRVATLGVTDASGFHATVFDEAKTRVLASEGNLFLRVTDPTGKEVYRATEAITITPGAHIILTPTVPVRVVPRSVANNGTVIYTNPPPPPPPPDLRQPPPAGVAAAPPASTVPASPAPPVPGIAMGKASFRVAVAQRLVAIRENEKHVRLFAAQSRQQKLKVSSAPTKAELFLGCVFNSPFMLWNPNACSQELCLTFPPGTEGPVKVLEASDLDYDIWLVQNCSGVMDQTCLNKLTDQQKQFCAKQHDACLISVAVQYCPQCLQYQ